jgi:hypothetical protein
MKKSPNETSCPLCGSNLERKNAHVLGDGIWKADSDAAPSVEDSDSIRVNWFHDCVNCRYVYP